MRNFIVINLLFLNFLFFISCSDDPSTAPVKSYAYNNDTIAALLVVVDDVNPPYNEGGYEEYIDDLRKIFSDMFEVDFEAVKDMYVDEIIDKYGEDWQIDKINSAGEKYYNKIITLTDGQVTVDNIHNRLMQLTSDGYVIDMIFSLHGSSSSIQLYNSSCDIREFTGKLSADNIKIRALYQTCCYGSKMIDEWEDIGIFAVNGSYEANSYGKFSPFYFLKAWTEGATFTEAVNKAYEEEIDYYRNFDSPLPVEDFFCSEKNFNSSRMSTGGKNKNLHWNEFPVE